MNLILGGPSPENLTGETERANADITLGYCDPSAGGSAGDNYLFTPAGGANPGNKFIELRRTLTNNVPATTFTNIRFKATSLSTLNSNDGGNQADFRPATSITRTGLVCGSANSLTLLDPPAYDALLGMPSGTMGGLNSSLRLPVTLNPASTVGMNFKVYYTTSGKPGFYWLTVTAKP